MKAPPPYRPVSGVAARIAQPRPAQSSVCCVRGRVVQGVFIVRPFSFHAVHPGAVQKKSAPQSRPGIEAFQVDLRPKSGGWPLPRDVQAKMEAALGANFSDVRVHVGPEALAIGAIAFTGGSDVHFAPGQYNPHTPHGQFLLGHELTHVVQQRVGSVANPFGSGVAVVQDNALEAEADRLGRMASMSRAHEVSSDMPALQMKPVAADYAVINRKAKATAHYQVRAPLAKGTGWQIQVAAQGMAQPVGSVQLTPSQDGVYISDLHIAPEHRRQGLAGQLIDAGLLTARSHGHRVAQLEARPDSVLDVAPSALVSMYRKLGFQSAGISSRGNPLMERRY